MFVRYRPGTLVAQGVFKLYTMKIPPIVALPQTESNPMKSFYLQLAAVNNLIIVFKHFFGGVFEGRRFTGSSAYNFHCPGFHGDHFDNYIFFNFHFFGFFHF